MQLQKLNECQSGFLPSLNTLNSILMVILSHELVVVAVHHRNNHQRTRERLKEEEKENQTVSPSRCMSDG